MSRYPFDYIPVRVRHGDVFAAVNVAITAASCVLLTLSVAHHRGWLLIVALVAMSIALVGQVALLTKRVLDRGYDAIDQAIEDEFGDRP